MEKKLKTQSSIGDSKTVYEVGYLLSSGIPEEKLADEVNSIKSLIETNGGVFVSDEFPKLRALAYTMTKVVGTRREKHTHGYFGWIKFEMNTEGVAKVKETLDVNVSIIRYLLVKTVRENTMSVIKPLKKEGDDMIKMPVKEESKEPVSEAEIDKSIEELVIE